MSFFGPDIDPEPAWLAKYTKRFTIAFNENLRQRLVTYEPFGTEVELILLVGGVPVPFADFSGPVQCLVDPRIDADSIIAVIREKDGGGVVLRVG